MKRKKSKDSFHKRIKKRTDIKKTVEFQEEHETNLTNFSLNNRSFFVHPTAIIEKDVSFGNNVKVWHFCHVRESAVLEDNVTLGKSVYIDKGVKIGKYSRIQNNVSIYRGVIIEPWCFIGPHVVFTNDMYPRAGALQWDIIETKLETGSSLGAGTIVRCGIIIGAFSMVGAGSVVTKSVAPFHLAIGIPSVSTNKICACGITKFPLHTSYVELLRDCCRRRMDQNFYFEAEKYIKTLLPQH